MELNIESNSLRELTDDQIIDNITVLTHRLLKEWQVIGEVNLPMEITYVGTYGARIRATLRTREELWK